MQPQSLEKQTIAQYFFVFFAIISFLYATYIAINYAHQIPLDLYSFRQTQTGLSAYWLMKNGFHFAYETPVAGLPWSIPFEFPIYQYLVATIAKFTGGDINTIARLVSYSFLILCLVPIRSITKNLQFPQTVFYLFVVLFLSSPIYLYWGRTVMIETAALFFSVAGIKYFVDIVQLNNSYKNQIFFGLFMSLSMLQKTTTAFPVLILLFLCYLVLVVNKIRPLKLIFNKKILFTLIFCFGLPLIIGVLWTTYTDHIKELNPFGSQLTSTALYYWNWGILSQRFSSVLYLDVVWKRIFEQNLSGMLGIAILITALCSKIDNTMKFTIIISLLLGLVPLYLFTNLHIVHTYYQTANVLFLIYAVALSVNCILTKYCKNSLISILIVMIMMTSNYCYFSKDYLDAVKTNYNGENSREYAVASVLKKEVPENKYFVAFGCDNWNSGLAYLSERKSFTVPESFKYYNEIALHPEQFIKDPLLGAVVVCSPIKIPTVDYFTQWVSMRKNWRIIEVQGCHIAYQLNNSLK